MKNINHKDITVTYYGTYNGAVVVNLRHRKLIYNFSVSNETVAGVTFIYSDSGDRITVWHGGEFYRLSDAHELGILTDENIAEIHEKDINQ